MAGSEPGEASFATERLDVGPWWAIGKRHGHDPVVVVSEVLTPTTTAALPEPWRGAYPVERARRWVAERDAESPTLLAVERSTGRAVGLVIVAVLDAEPDIGTAGGERDLRLGYVLAESAWGRGLATELVGGLVGWARSEPTIATITAGVEAGNDASVAVLARNGFEPVAGAADRSETERIFRLVVSRPAPS